MIEDVAFFTGVVLAVLSSVLTGLVFLLRWLGRADKLLDLIRKSGEKIELQVSTDKGAYLPGETVDVTVTLVGKRGFAVDEGRVELRCENEYTYSEERTDYDSNSGARSTYTIDVTETDEIFCDVRKIFENRTIRAAESSTHSVSYTLPAKAVPSGNGDITSVDWKVCAVLSRHRRLDCTASVPIEVLSSLAANSKRTVSRPKKEDAKEVKLDLRLAGGRDVRPEDLIEGTLVVIPREGLKAGVRVELVEHDGVPRDAGNESEVVQQSMVLSERSDLTAQRSYEFPFRLPIPIGACPCLRTKQSTVRWWLRGVVDRPGKRDALVDVELNVYTAGACEGERRAVEEARSLV